MELPKQIGDGIHRFLASVLANSKAPPHPGNIVCFGSSMVKTRSRRTGSRLWTESLPCWKGCVWCPPGFCPDRRSPLLHYQPFAILGFDGDKLVHMGAHHRAFADELPSTSSG